MSKEPVFYTSGLNDPTTWDSEDFGVIHFATSEDAKKAETLFNRMADALETRPEVGVAEQEPVAWRWRLRNHGLEGWLYGGRAPTSLAQNLNYQVEPLYGYPWRSMNVGRE